MVQETLEDAYDKHNRVIGQNFVTTMKNCFRVYKERFMVGVSPQKFVKFPY